MKKSILFLSIFVLLFSFSFNCSNEKSTEPEQKELSTEEQLVIEQTHETVAVKADSLLLTDDPIQGFEQMLSRFKNDENVDNAWIKDDALYVKYKKGGIVSWQVPDNDVKPPYLPKSSVSFLNYSTSNNDNIVGNNKVCLINQQHNDQSRPYCDEIIDRLDAYFSQNNFDVTIVNGGDADLDFFDSELSEFGTIYCIPHGHYDGDNTWICLGQEGRISDLTKAFYWDWVGNEISVGTVKEERNGKRVAVPYVTISNNFIDDEYEGGDFPNSLIYMSACQFFTSSNFGMAFGSKGAGATVGWDETNCKGKFVGEHMLKAMLGGLSLSEAIEILPEESRVDYCAVESGAYLEFYPSSGETLQLVQAPSTVPDIEFYDPLDSQSYTSRVLTLHGKVINAQRIEYGTLELNNITTTLETTGLEFSQPIVLKQGDNTIKVTCLTKGDDGTSSITSKSITVTGDFPVLDLFSELRWNTNSSDVDLHLLPPGSDLDDLFSTKDCYWDNMITSWQGILDVDDVDGYGPEHIEIPKAEMSGTYRMFVHYWDDDGGGISQAFVDISAQGGKAVSFGPYDLMNSVAGYNSNNSIGDVYEVCTIDFPGGRITPVNQYHFIKMPSELAKSSLRGKSKK